MGYKTTSLGGVGINKKTYASIACVVFYEVSSTAAVFGQKALAVPIKTDINSVAFYTRHVLGRTTVEFNE